VPTIIVIFVVGGGFMAKYASLAMKEYGTASTVAEEIISSVRTAQAFGMQEKLSKLYDDNLVSAQRTGYKQQFAGAVMLAAMFFSIYAFYGLGFCTWRPMTYLIAGEGGRLLADGNLTIGTILTVLFAVIIGSFSLGSLGPRIEAFAKASAAAQKIFQTLARIPTIDSLDDTGEKPEGIVGEIEFNNVSFIYPARPEGWPLLFKAHRSDCFEKCQPQNSQAEIYCVGWSLGVREVHCFATFGAVLWSSWGRSFTGWT
jgi:ATP-binding cassette, subfamily B (MDR/TAP), member 1